MPLYLFEHPETGEEREVFFKMEDDKTFIDGNGVQWSRIYTVPQASMDTRIDPHSSRAFVEKTRKAGTFGEMFDLSKEMSEKRGGKKNDPVKKSYEKEWKGRRKPVHPKP